MPNRPCCAQRKLPWAPKARSAQPCGTSFHKSDAFQSFGVQSLKTKAFLSNTLHLILPPLGLGKKSFGLAAPHRRSVLQPGRTGAGTAVRTEPLKSGSNILQSLWKPTGVLCIATDIHINLEHFVQVHTVGSLQSYKYSPTLRTPTPLL